MISYSSRSVIALTLLGAVFAQAPAFARQDSNVIAKAAPMPQLGQSAVDGYALADQIESLIAMRAAMMERTAPQPATNCKDEGEVARRLTALAELDGFARSTVAGLIDAAPSLELRAMTEEKLMLVMLEHRAGMRTAYGNLLDLPVVREKGALAADIARLAEQAARP